MIMVLLGVVVVVVVVSEFFFFSFVVAHFFKKVDLICKEAELPKEIQGEAFERPWHPFQGKKTFTSSTRVMRKNSCHLRRQSNAVFYNAVP